MGGGDYLPMFCEVKTRHGNTSDVTADVDGLEALCLWSLERDRPEKTNCKHNVMIVGGSVVMCAHRACT